METGIPVQFLEQTDYLMIQTMRRYLVERRSGHGL